MRLEPDGRLCYDHGVMQQDDRAPPLLAVVRIVCVLGMSFCIAAGIFLLLFPEWLLALATFLGAIPFSYVMRFMEKRAMQE